MDHRRRRSGRRLWSRHLITAGLSIDRFRDSALLPLPGDTLRLRLQIDRPPLASKGEPAGIRFVARECPTRLSRNLSGASGARVLSHRAARKEFRLLSETAVSLAR